MCSREPLRIVISPGVEGFVVGGTPPPRVYGWCAKPETLSRLKPPQLSPVRGPTQSRALMNVVGSAFTRARQREREEPERPRRHELTLLPIGAVSPSRRRSRLWPVARRPESPDRASAR